MIKELYESIYNIPVDTKAKGVYILGNRDYCLEILDNDVEKCQKPEFPGIVFVYSNNIMRETEKKNYETVNQKVTNVGFSSAYPSSKGVTLESYVFLHKSLKEYPEIENLVTEFRLADLSIDAPELEFIKPLCSCVSAMINMKKKGADHKKLVDFSKELFELHSSNVNCDSKDDAERKEEIWYLDKLEKALDVISKQELNANITWRSVLNEIGVKC